MAHAIWKGSISFGLVEIPVGLYSAESPEELHFNMLDKRDHAPIGYQRINKTTGETVEWGDIVKGFELDDGRMVILDEDDFKKANVEATETVDIVEFVDAHEIETVYYDKPYYLAPLSRGGKAYALLRETLRRSGKVGIAKVVIRTRQYVAALVVRERALVLNILRYAHELRSEDDLELPGDDLHEVGVSDKEIELAERLVSGMVARFDPTQFHDEYREDLLALIEKKAETGRTEAVHTRKREKATGVVDIMELLKKSVASRSSNEDEEAGRRGRAAPSRGHEAAGGEKARAHETKPRRAAARRPRRAAGKK